MFSHPHDLRSSNPIQANTGRRRALMWLLAAGLAPALTRAELPYPAQPLRLVVPFSSGSATDVLARQFAAAWARELGQSITVDNKPGGGAIIGAETVAKSPPDGYTLLLGSSQSHATNSSLFKKLPYDPLADFAPVARITVFPAVLVVRYGIPVRSVAEFVAYAKLDPGRLNYASSGPGTQGHLQAAMLAATAGLQVTHIPFKDAGQIFTAFGRGDVDFMFYPYSALGPIIQTGQVRVLASTGERRSAITADTPTMTEAGYPEVTLAAWNALYAPAATPQPVIELLATTTRRALDNPALQTRMADLGIDIAYLSPTELGRFTRAEIERYRRLVAITGLKAE